MIQEIYKLLGPLDYNLFTPEDELEEQNNLKVEESGSEGDEEGRMMQYDF